MTLSLHPQQRVLCKRTCKHVCLCYRNTAFTKRPNIRSRPAATQEAQPVNVIDCGCIPIWCSSDDRLSWAGHRDTTSEEGPVWAAICSRGPLGEYRSITTRTTQHIYVLLPLPNLSTSMVQSYLASAFLQKCHIQTTKLHIQQKYRKILKYDDII